MFAFWQLLFFFFFCIHRDGVKKFKWEIASLKLMAYDIGDSPMNLLTEAFVQ